MLCHHKLAEQLQCIFAQILQGSGTVLDIPKDIPSTVFIYLFIFNGSGECCLGCRYKICPWCSVWLRSSDSDGLYHSLIA